MQLEEFCRVAGLDRSFRLILEPYWESAKATFTGMPEFMTAGFCEKYYPKTGGRADVPALIREVAAQAAGMPAVQLYAWTLYRGFFIEPDCGKLGKLPPLFKLLGDRAGILNLMVAISGIPLVECAVKNMGLPAAMADDMVRWVGGTIELYAAGHGGVPGHNLSQTHWMRHYIEGKLFRIGRFEYLLHGTPDWVPAIYRRNADGRAIALCRDGWRFDAEGLRAAANAAAAHTARLEMYRGRVAGTPISPCGRAQIGRRVELELSEWSPALAPWEYVPSIHIPVGGGMTPELAVASMREAVGFFREHFHFEPKMFVCHSWILNPDWEGELPESNLVKLMRLAYSTPGEPPGGMEGLFFIFGRSGDADWSSYPADTSVRRAFHRVREKQRTLRNGAMFVLTEDLDRLADGFYRDGSTPV